MRGGWRLRGPKGSREILVQHTGKVMRSYGEGRLTDADLLAKLREEAGSRLVAGAGPVYVVGDQTFDSDSKAFVSALNPTEDERLVLERVLAGETGALILEEPRVASCILARQGRLRDGLRALTDDESLIALALKDAGNEPAPETIRRLAALEKGRRVAGELPLLAHLGPCGSYLDRIARLAKAGDIDGALRVAEKDIPTQAKGKALACAMISAMDALHSRAWLFTPLETESGCYLKEKAKALLDAKGDAYRDALNDLLLHSGSGESVDR
jgi:hypothetical protein